MQTLRMCLRLIRYCTVKILFISICGGLAHYGDQHETHVPVLCVFHSILLWEKHKGRSLVLQPEYGLSLGVPSLLC